MTRSADAEILIAGVTGTLGRAIAIEFARQGRQVRGVARGRTREPSQVVLDRVAGIELVRGDLLDPAFVEEVCAGVTTVVFAAGASGVAASFQDPAANLVQSAVPWLYLLRAVSPGNRIILLSSQTVYGPAEGEAFTTKSPVRPASPYALHRATMEGQARILSPRYGIETVTLRLGNVYGEVSEVRRDRMHGVVERMLADLYYHNVASLYGDGSQMLELLHADDLARAVLAVAATPTVQGSFRVFNLHGGRLSVRQIADALCCGLGRGATASVPWEPGMEQAMAKDVRLDDGLFRRAYDWQPTIEARDAIEVLARAWR